MKGKGKFSDLLIQRRDVPQSGIGHYRVYKDANEFIRVEAPSALEALQLSGIGQVYKIQRDTFSTLNVLKLDAVGAAEPPPPAVAPPLQTDAEAQTEPAPPPPAAAAETALSSDEVSRLLQS